MTARSVTLEPYMKETVAPGAFRALLWKEFRELVRPGLSALAIVAVGLWFSAAIGRSYVSADIYVEASGSTPSLFTLTSAVVGLLIGWSQIRRENRGDAWALLVHRPVRRSTIFWSKAVAGGIAYLLAAGIPMLIAAAWQATPGNRAAPYDIRLMLPDVADLACGLVYYAAALLSTMREARWYASRALPIGAAMVCSTFVIATPSIAVALLVSAAGVLVVGTAARAAFIWGGFYEPQPEAARALLGVSTTFGLVIVGSLALTLISVFLVVNRPFVPTMTRVAVASDGSIVRVARTFVPFAMPTVQVTDLEGHPLHMSTSGVLSTPELALDSTAQPRGYRSTANVFVPVASSPGRGGATSWYYVRRERLIVMYDNVSFLRIGWIGPNGYAPGDAPPAARFQGELRPLPPFGYTRSLIAFPGAVYQLGREQRSVQRIFTPAGGEQVVSASAAAGETEHGVVDVSALPSAEGFAAIVTTGRVVVQSGDGATELNVARDPRAAGYGMLHVARAILATGRPTFVWYSANGGSLPDAVRDTAKDQITKFDSTGTAIMHVAVRADSMIGPPEPTQWAEIIVRRFLEPIVMPVWHAVRHPGEHTPAARPERVSPAVAGWIASLVGAIVFAIVAYGVAVRYAFPPPRRTWWTIVGFAGGALGVLLMLSLIEWPARVPCPACGKERVVTRERCEHCGAPFPPPPRDGTEIFEAATV